MMNYSFGFCVNGIITCSCAILGLVLNCITIYILTSKKDLHNLFNRLLLWLLWFDNFVLVTWLLARIIIDFKVNADIFIWIFPYFTFPFGAISQSASTFMTVTLAHERYVAVRDPMKYNQSNLNPKTQSLRAMMYAIPVIVFSILYNVPFFLCFRLERADENLGKFAVVVTELRQNPLFIRYYINWTRCIVSGVIPFLTLFYYNLRFYKIIRKASIRKRNLTVKNRASVKKTDDKERNMAILMFGIVVIFLICHSLKMILNFAEGVDSSVLTSPWFGIAAPLSNFLVIINSSINMVVYVILNSKFKEHLVEIFQNVWTKLGCKTSQSNTRTNEVLEEQFSNVLQPDEMIEKETTVVVETPKLSRNLKDTRPPVYV